jgi:hypothetical protein
MLAAAALAALSAAAGAGPHKSTGALSESTADFKDARVDPVGTVSGAARPADLMDTLRNPPSRGEQILFGDLHVHSTVSWDAFVFSLPVFGGTGAHPPADACDFARYCSSLDFFSLTDHAETLTPRQWSENKKVLRQCSAVGSSGSTEDLITFTGFEWTQAGTTRENHYGHRNVIFRDQDEAHLPRRSISPMPPYFDPDLPVLTKMREPRVSGYVAMMQELSKVPVCAGRDASFAPAATRSTCRPRSAIDGSARPGSESWMRRWVSRQPDFLPYREPRPKSGSTPGSAVIASCPPGITTPWARCNIFWRLAKIDKAKILCASDSA